MPSLIALALLLPLLTNAAPLLDPGATYAVKKERKEMGSVQKVIENAYAEMKSDLESFDLSDGKARLLLANKTEQLFSLKTLPQDPKAGTKDGPKDGLSHALELKFEKLKSMSEVYLGGMAKPFSTGIDLGSVLAQTPLVIRGDGKTAKKVEGLEAARTKALSQVTNQAARNTVLGLLDESVLLRTSSATSTGGCLGGFEKRSVGDKWEFSLTEQGTKLEYDCAFEGWAEAKGKKVAVVAITLRKSRQVRQQPNGVPGMAETSGQGKLYFVPDTQESLMRMETEILTEPMEDEIRSLKARGQPVPRNRTLMKHWNRLYPI